MRLIFTYLFSIVFLFSEAQTLATFTQLGPVKFPLNPSVQTTGMGRVSQLVYHPNDSNILFAVTASGGIFKTSNEGATWKPLSDNLPQTTCASLLINPINPNTMYLGTGDANYDGNGLGVYKSTDAGATWFVSNSGMGSILVSEMYFTPNDTNTIIAACKNGIYKSINAGATWTKKTTVNVSYRSLCYKPQSTTILYAASTTNFYSSFNNGETWISTNINPAITSAGIKIAVCPSDTSRIYCLVWKSGATSPFGGIYKSTNNGGTFTLQADTPNIMGYSNNGTSMDGQGAYNMALIVDPLDANILYMGAINLWKSTNAGASYSLLSHWGYGVHADKHNFLFSPYNKNKLYICHDGGLDRSSNAGATWTTLEDGLSASEFYKMGASGLYNDYIIGGLQDNGKDIGINKTFSTIGGGDWSGDFEFDKFDSSLVYEHGGVRRNIVLNNSASINGHGGVYLAHPNNSNVLFEIDTNVRISTNLRVVPSTAVTWTTISAIAGTVPTGTKCHAYAKASSGTYYVAFSPQLFYKSININDPIPSFTQITSFPFGSGEVIKQIETADNDSNTLYAVSSLNRLYKSNNKGLTWFNISKNLPASTFIKFELDQNANDSSMYLCTPFAVYYRNSSLVNWVSFSQGLPVVARISDMEIMCNGTEKSRLFISTYGRGIWISNLYSTANKAPIVDFSMQANSNQTCANTYILNSNCANSPNKTIWRITPQTGWQFINGTDSSNTRAEIIFSIPGAYTISLIASNNFGSNTKNIYFNYAPNTASPCLTTTTNLSGYGMGIQQFEFNTLLNSSGIGVASNTDYTCNKSTFVKAGTTYTAYITTGTTNPENQKIYIDYNNNGVFTDANELVASQAAGTGKRPISVSILSTPPLPQQFLRMRVVTNFSTATAASCGVLSYGESEDYAIFIDTLIPLINIGIPKPQVNGNFIATFTSNKSLIGFDSNDIVLTNGSASKFMQTGPFEFSCTVTPSVYGKVWVQINANSFTDLAGNSNLLAIDSTYNGWVPVETNLSVRNNTIGPFETDTFYSPAGNIMAISSNLSGFNYGLCTLSIDSAGIGTSNYASNTSANKKIARKTFRLITSNNNTSGQIAIRLFYSQAEINAWKLATGNNFSNANIIKTPAAISTGTLANGQYGTNRNTAPYSSNDSSIYAIFNSGFGGFAIGADVIVLPVKFLEFSATKIKNQVVLNWTTSSETNSAYFEVERSTDGIEFEKIARLKAAGNSTNLKYYTITDKNYAALNVQTVYYRIKEIDMDASFDYSVCRTIEKEEEEIQITLMPQPAKDLLTINCKQALEFKYEIWDNNGQLQSKGSSNSQNTQLAISNLKSGIYYLHLIHLPQLNQVLKFVKLE